MKRFIFVEMVIAASYLPVVQMYIAFVLKENDSHIMKVSPIIREMKCLKTFFEL